jgi:hypothetical protein
VSDAATPPKPADTTPSPRPTMTAEIAAELLRRDAETASKAAAMNRKKARASAREAADLKAKLDAAEKRLAELEKPRPETKPEPSAPPKPGSIEAELAELKREKADREHRSAFAKAAKALHVADGDVDDLFTLSGYKAEGDPDEKAIGEVLAKAKEARPRYFGDPAAKPAEKAPLAEPPGSGRGASDRGPSLSAADVVGKRFADAGLTDAFKIK